MCDILLVEDNRRFRRTLVGSLAGRFPDAVIEAVDTGEAAVEYVAHTIPRILLLDLGLPGMNGLQVMERIRPRSAQAKIVVITGNDSLEYKEAARSRGADYFVSKNSARLEEILALAGELLGIEERFNGAGEQFRLSGSP